jgi:hypothetical protein
MKKIFYITVLIGAVVFAISSCTKDLDTSPIDPDEVTSGNVFNDPEAYTQFMAKCYAGLAVGGQEGGDGKPDVAGIDGGFSQYLRQYWYHQELSTDEALISWDDATIKDFHYQQWGSGDNFIAAMYYRIYYQISLCNEYLRQTEDGVLNDRGVSDEWRAKIKDYRLEARWLRSLSYWHALDLFGSVPFVTETDPVGDADFFPPQATQVELFDFIESELKEIESQMMAPRTNEYGRADQAAAWTLLAKLYMNAEVYIGQDRYAECINYCDKVIASSYELAPSWQQVFWANNDQIDETMREIIFPIRYDGERTQTWGGITFIIHAGIGGSMVGPDYGVDGGWGGTRVTPNYYQRFDDPNNDVRATFYTDGQTYNIADVGDFTNGYAYPKFVNYSIVNETKVDGYSQSFPDTDFPMFRVADIYLMYAEAVARGGGGSMAQAVDYVNDLRSRAGVGTISESDLTKEFVLDERARELGWECHRRTDLIRFGLFTSGEYVWEWKGNTQQGRATDAKYNLYPLPAADVNANPNLVQNPNY